MLCVVAADAENAVNWKSLGSTSNGQHWQFPKWKNRWWCVHKKSFNSDKTGGEKRPQALRVNW
jgi:hypothetical protein